MRRSSTAARMIFETICAALLTVEGARPDADRSAIQARSSAFWMLVSGRSPKRGTMCTRR